MQRIPSWKFLVLPLVALLAAGCPDKDPIGDPDAGVPDSGVPDSGVPVGVSERHTTLIGPRAATVSFSDGATFEVPAFAVDAEMELVSWRVELQQEDGTTQTSYRFEPSNLVFVRPATLRVPVPVNASEGGIEWRSPSGDFESHGGTVEEGHFVSQTVQTGEARVTSTRAELRAITGVALTTHIARDGTRTSKPNADLGSTLTAHVPDGQGGLELREVPLAANGTFRIEGVPFGDYLLRGEMSDRPIVDDSWHFFDASVLDLGQDTVRRASLESGAPGTAIALELFNLDPDFDLSVVSTSAQVWEGSGQSRGVTSGGAALIGDFTDFWIDGPKLIDTTQGDDLLAVNQAKHTPVDGAPYSVVTQVATFPPFVQPSGVESILSGAMRRLTLDRRFNMSIAHDEYALAFAAGSPTAPAAVLGSVQVNLNRIAPAFDWGGVPLLDFSVGGEPRPLVADFGIPSEQLGEPVVSAYLYARIPFQLEGTSRASLLSLNHSDRRTLEEGNEKVWRPRIGPVTGLEIDGRDAKVEQTNIPAAATISWRPPVFGTASHYDLELYRLYASVSGGEVRTNSEQVLRMYSARTAVRFPPGTLVSGETYVVNVRVDQRRDPVTAPRRFSMDYANAETLSAMFRIAE